MKQRVKFVETLRVENGVIDAGEKHCLRLNQTVYQFYHKNINFDLREIIIPKEFKNDIVKCRILYSSQIEKIEFLLYRRKIIHSLKAVDGKQIDYSWKYANRCALESLLRQKENHDEIIIIRNRYVTDTSFSNVIFSDGKGYYTPNTFLLNGIRRQQLLETGFIKEMEISVEDIPSFKKVFLINTMLLPEDAVTIDTTDIDISTFQK
jgi:4-amino-4-deoxychorismate lyase